MKFYQKIISLPAFPRGCHLITSFIYKEIPEISHIKIGMFSVFIRHTSASLTINENADPDVPHDLETLLCSWAKDDFLYRHTEEGPDDMSAHGKASLMGAQLSIPVKNGQLLLGTWQGIYLCEHRLHAGCRQLVLTLWGEEHPDK
ncbi:MAG: secondary thiamine-phosphate synthase enzyme YjbQ [Planctomycetia bacterium]|nr:secondary thiamine-phosphate synthase enzyme YjbQ [Planctomycetia bacterium]